MANGNIPTAPKKKVIKLRQYQAIWEAIKQAAPGTPVKVKVHYTAEKRLIQAVRKEKTTEVAVEKKVGMMTAGPLVNTSESEIIDGKVTGFVIIRFSLAWDASKL